MDNGTQAALQLAEELSTPFHSAFAAGLLATYYTHYRDPANALLSAEWAIKLSEKYGFSHWFALGILLQGWALTKTGKGNEGISRLEEGIERWNSAGAEMAMPTFQALLADAYQAAGDRDKALRSVEEGLAISKRSQKSYYDAELYRLKGELLAQNKRQNSNEMRKEADRCFRTAIEIARRQDAKSLELRASMSLYRLWHRTGKETEAKKSLSKIYGWFTEGFGTGDLKEAKKLLQRLSFIVLAVRNYLPSELFEWSLPII